ncbi:MAG: hypothetical protein AB7O59_08840 [Pirellulales bacterium]
MRSADLKADQLETLQQKLAPILDYLHRLRDRATRQQFPHGVNAGSNLAQRDAKQLPVSRLLERPASAASVTNDLSAARFLDH